MVPTAWKPVLQAWNDPSIGVGLEAPWPSPGSASGSGSVAVEGTEGIADAMADAAHTQLSDGENTQPGNEPGDPSTSGSAELPSHSQREGLGEGLRQTNLRSWLK